MNDDATAWEAEHLIDLVDDADRFVQFPLVDVAPLDPVEEYRARRAAEMERDYWHDRYLDLLDDLERGIGDDERRRIRSRR